MVVVVMVVQVPSLVVLAPVLVQVQAPVLVVLTLGIGMMLPL
jgi:hypothetical protein